MRHYIAALFLCCLPVAASALESDSPMTAAEFEAYVTGRTLTFGVDGLVYGIEQYLPGRRVIWAFVGEECREGHWFEVGSHICFEYDDEPGQLHCWSFYQTEDGLRARSMGIGTDLVEVEQSPEPMFCPGPDVGA